MEHIKVTFTSGGVWRATFKTHNGTIQATASVRLVKDRDGVFDWGKLDARLTLCRANTELFKAPVDFVEARR